MWPCKVTSKGGIDFVHGFGSLNLNALSATSDNSSLSLSQMPHREFLSAFQTCLRIPFLRAEKDPAVYRTLEFAARFCTELGTNIEEDNDGELSPFLQDMFKYLLEVSVVLVY